MLQHTTNCNSDNSVESDGSETHYPISHVTICSFQPPNHKPPCWQKNTMSMASRSWHHRLMAGSRASRIRLATGTPHRTSALPLATFSCFFSWASGFMSKLASSRNSNGMMVSIKKSCWTFFSLVFFFFFFASSLVSHVVIIASLAAWDSSMSCPCVDLFVSRTNRHHQWICADETRNTFMGDACRYLHDICLRGIYMSLFLVFSRPGFVVTECAPSNTMAVFTRAPISWPSSFHSPNCFPKSCSSYIISDSALFCGTLILSGFSAFASLAITLESSFLVCLGAGQSPKDGIHSLRVPASTYPHFTRRLLSRASWLTWFSSCYRFLSCISFRFRFGRNCVSFQSLESDQCKCLFYLSRASTGTVHWLTMINFL